MYPTLNHRITGSTGRRVAALAAGAALLLAACGSDSEAEPAAAPADAAEQTTDDENTAADDATEAMDDDAMETMDDDAMEAMDESADTDASLQIASSELGDHLVDRAGNTLYGFTADVDGVPTCEGGCAEAWPPALADSVPADWDPEVFTLVDGPAGTQLKAGKWPLYRFGGDIAPGDVNGQGSGDVWFVVAPDGSLIGADGDAEGLSGTDAGTDNDGDDETSNGSYDY